MKRPVIGVTGDRDESNGRYYIKQEYIQAVWQTGGVPLIIEYPLDIPQNWSGDRKAWLDSVDVKEEIFDRVDGLLFTGGCDVDPAFFEERVSVDNGPIDPFRDVYEISLAKEAIKRGVPCLGLCRGIQLMAVAAGGKLHQDIYHELGTRDQHGQKAPVWYPTHQVATAKGSKLFSILGEKVWVNSFHHQCIVEDPSMPYQVTAHGLDGTPEGLEKPELPFYVGVQWHPERMMQDPVQMGLFRALLEAASERRSLIEP